MPESKCIVVLGAGLATGKRRMTTTDAHLVNEQVARTICERHEIEGQRYEPGAFVAIAEGRVVGVGNSFDEADALLVNLGLPPGEGIICEVAEAVVDVVRREPRSCV